MEQDTWFFKDMLLALHDDEYEYGYFKNHGYFKHCNLDSIDNDCVAVPLRYIVPQYLTFDSSMDVCNAAYLNETIVYDEYLLNEMLKEYSGKVSLIDLMKKNISMIILNRANDGIFYEISSGQKIASFPVPIYFPIDGKWSDFNSIYADYLKEDLDNLFNFPIVYDGSFIFEMNDDEKKYIEYYSKYCFKDTLKKRFKRFMDDAVKGNKMVLNVMENFVDNNKSCDYVYSSLVKKRK